MTRIGAAHVRREADHRTALALAVTWTVGIVAIVLQVTGSAPLVPVLATQAALTAAVMSWHAWTTHFLPRKAARRG